MKRRTIILYMILALLVLALALTNICFGSTDLSFPEILNILSGRGASDTGFKIIWNIRIPRVLAASFLGGGLALSGYLLQAFFGNPIAGPFVLGISSGAKLVVALLLVFACQAGFAVSGAMMVAAAFAGSVLATIFVMAAAGRVHQISVLIVCGIMIGYVCSAVTEMVVTFADDSNIVNLHNWSMGSFQASGMEDAAEFIPIVLAGLAAALLLSKAIGAYLYGEAYAFSLGIPVKLFRILLITVSGILSATVTAFAGPISFVGVAVPHVVHSLFKTSEPKVLITASFLGGAAFCLFCDLLARCLFAPTELSISTVTAIFGAPVVVFLLLANRRN